MEIYAAVLAGGTGKRFGTALPKQFQKWDGISLLRRSLLAFENHPAVSGIVVVAPEDFQGETLAECKGIHKLLGMVIGGETRTGSTRAALSALPPAGAVLIHDAARCMVSGDLISRVVDAMQKNRAVSCAVPVTDTIYRCDASGVLQEIPERSALFAAQTPQGFDLPLIREALRAPDAEATDDATLVLRYTREAVKIVPGDPANIKITMPDDLTFFSSKRK